MKALTDHFTPTFLDKRRKELQVGGGGRWRDRWRGWKERYEEEEEWL